MKCILDGFKRGGCATCPAQCPHFIALYGLNGKGGRIGAAGIPDDYRNVTLANSPARESQADIYASLARYADTFAGNDVKSAYLWSESPGTGKTTTAVALLHEYIARNYIAALKRGEQPAQVMAVFLDVNEFQSEYNLAAMTHDEDAMKRIGAKIKRVQQAPFAVLDDVGVRSATEAFSAYLHAIINHRVANGLPTVYTSNVAIDELRDVFTARLYDRIRDNCGVIHFGGSSKRGRR
ncbi:DNA replication protein [Sporosarcina sp. SAFN-015]|uniref:DNA replication protein n=1 Tax=Sporosarcina sp. SAFN-015 TaxID=3387274 RepID=UPI003F81708D